MVRVIILLVIVLIELAGGVNVEVTQRTHVIMILFALDGESHVASKCPSLKKAQKPRADNPYRERVRSPANNKKPNSVQIVDSNSYS